MKKVRNLFAIVVCLALIGALIAGCGGSSKSNNGGDPTPTPGGSTSSWIETFDKVPNGISIRPVDADSRVSTLDNPDSFLYGNMSGDIIAGTTAGGTGTIDLRGTEAGKEGNSQRMAFVVPGLSAASAPVLKLTIKNDNGSGSAVAGLTIFVGDSYSTSGNPGVTGHRAHGAFAISNTSYQVVEIPLNTSFLVTNMIQIRPVVGTSSTDAAGIYIDKIEVTGVPETGSTPTPTPTPSTEPTPTPIPDPLYVFTEFSENFDGATTETFFTNGYKPLVSDSTKPMFYSTGGTSVTTIEDIEGNKALKLGSSARFTIGQTVQEKDNTAAGVYPKGEFDLSKPYKISFKVVDVLSDGTKKFQVYVDNNTTGGANSYHGGSTTSRIYSENLATHTAGNTVEITSSVGTTRSFIQLRVETTAGYITIDDLVIEYQ